MQAALDAVTILDGSLDADLLIQGRAQKVTFQSAHPIQFKNVTPMTPDGKIQLNPSCLAPHGYSWLKPDESEHRFQLISPATSKLVNSSLGEFQLPQLIVQINDRDAQSMGIENGEKVRVWNHLGEVVCPCKVTSSIRSGVLSMPKGAWRRSSENTYTSVAFCSDEVGHVGGNACFNDTRVSVEPWPQL